MSTSDESCNVGAYTSKSKSDGLCDVNDKLQNMRIGAAISVCANCGKEDDDVNNVCNKCKQVKYCNAACKKVHKKKHKKECEELIRLATEKLDEELRLAAELHGIELFKEPPSQHGDCPICFLRLPNLNSGWKYQLCCGKQICMGCYYAPVYDNQGNKVDDEKCPYCRTPRPITQEELIERTRKLIEKNNAIAIYDKGYDYFLGKGRHPQDYDKALELFQRAGELGHAMAYSNIGYAYEFGRGVDVDKKKALHNYELAAMGGNTTARYNLGVNEEVAGNMDRAIKHYMIAARGGYNLSMKRIKELYTYGNITKGDYTKALHLYQTYLGEIKSPQRDKAVLADEDSCYY